MMMFDSVMCMVFPRLARWVVVGELKSKAFYVLDNVVFMRHRHAERWIEEVSKPLHGGGTYAIKRIKRR